METEYHSELGISVIIPVYNAEKYIEKAVLSITSQTGDYLHIVCVDDGSTDSSLLILNRMARIYSNVVVLHQENRGSGGARNAGIEYALKDHDIHYFAFLDADDLFVPDFFDNALVNDLKDRYDMYAFQVVRCNDSATAFGFPSKQHYTGVIEGGEKAVWSVEQYCANLYSRKIIEKYGLRFPENMVYSEDQVFLKQCLALSKQIEIIPRPMYIYRANPSSLMTRRKRISPLDYYPPIIQGWKASDDTLKALTGITYSYGNTLACLYMLDMAKEYFQCFGSVDRLNEILRNNPQYPHFTKITERDFAPDQWAEYKEFMNHPKRFKFKNAVRGFMDCVLFVALKMTWCKHYYERKKYPLSLTDIS